MNCRFWQRLKSKNEKADVRCCMLEKSGVWSLESGVKGKSKELFLTSDSRLQTPDFLLAFQQRDGSAGHLKTCSSQPVPNNDSLPARPGVISLKGFGSDK